jgi:formamidopyrimidine-DNA glycosylase
MPELPEVETIRRALRNGQKDSPSLIGREIIAAQLFWERTLAAPSPNLFKKRIIGQIVQEIDRRAKYLLLRLSKDTLVIHLRMSGDLLVENSADPIAAHHRMVLIFDEELRLAFNDPRKFGRVWLLEDPNTLLNSLGPEPLAPSFNAEKLFQRLNSRRRQLKPLLLDQNFIAGLGNIYADEALHRAGLHPKVIASTLTYEQAKHLYRSIREVLNEGIDRSGASIDWVYRGGDFQNHFRVYQQTGEPCPRCGTSIERITVGQRGTHFCPQCQPLPEE